jgi:hypothetical protein
MTDMPHDDYVLPEGVGAVMRGPDGRALYILDPFLSENRWPGVAVNSASFKKLSSPEKFYEQAIAFLQATKVLCETAGQAGENLRWSQGSVCFYCLNLATELFLKACISRSSGMNEIPTHELSKLLARYGEILPEPEFRFPTPWAMSASEIERVLGAQIFNSIDRNPDQLYRYGVGRDGAESAGVQFFNPGYMFNYLTHLNNVWERAWNEVSKGRG